MPYLVDGYNLLFYLYSEESSIDLAREKLIATLASSGPKFTQLIFDNSYPTPHYPARIMRGRLEIIYAPGHQTADSYIIEYLQSLHHPQKYTIVTADKEIIRHAKEYHARIEIPQEFCKHLRKTKSHFEKPTADTSDEIQRLLERFEEDD